MRKMMVMVFSVIGILWATALFADCEEEWNRLQQADVAAHRAQAAYAAAQQAYQQAQANLNAAVAQMNAVGAKLGLTGRAASGSVTFGRSPSGATFFDNPDYRAAKQAWQDAKAANEQAEGEMDAAGSQREKARDEYDAAKKAYEECKKRARRLGDDGLLLGPEPLKLDKTLDQKVHDLLLYGSISKEDTTSEVAFVLTRQGGRTLLESSILTTGKGAEYRRWVPEGSSLVMPFGRLAPVQTSNFYPRKESLAGGAAPLIFAAIGSQYQKDAAKASYSPGVACEVSPSQGVKKSTMSNAINRVGMAAGLGLLTSKSGGDLKGVRNTFDVTGHEAELKEARLQFSVVNRNAHKSLPVSLSVKLDAKDLA